MTKSKILNLGLILSSLIVYLEWGGNNAMFLAQGELDLITKMIHDPLSVIHPLTVLPLIGQLLLAITLFQKTPSKWLTYLGLGGIGVLVLLIFAIGVMSMKVTIAISTIPFLLIGFLVIKNQKSK